MAAHAGGEKERAAAALGRALRAGLEDARAVRTYLELQAEAGTPDAALDAAVAYLGRWPGDWDTRRAAAWVPLNSGRFDEAEALAAARPPEQQTPPDVDVMVALATDRTADAQAALARFVADLPEWPSLRLIHAEALIRLDRRAEAAAELDAAAERRPNCGAGALKVIAKFQCCTGHIDPPTS